MPPLAKIAFVRVERALIVYIPGWNASPKTNTLIDLSAPSLPAASVPIILPLTVPSTFFLSITMVLLDPVSLWYLELTRQKVDLPD